MLDREPTSEELTALLGERLYETWQQLRAFVEERYDMERFWNAGGKAWAYEHKYRRGGKTLCALYAREGCMGFMIILGKDERARFEAERGAYSEHVRAIYDAAKTYRDGKWLMFEPMDTTLFHDFAKLLNIKRRPNRK